MTLDGDSAARLHASSFSSASLASSPFAALTFPELITYATRFLTDFHDSPLADSHKTAVALLASLRSLHPTSAVQQSLQARVVESLAELLGEIPVDAPAEERDDSVQQHDEDEHCEAVAVERIAVAAHAVPHRTGASIETTVMDLYPVDERASTGDAKRKDSAVRFNDAYSTDQMLVDSLPTLETEEIIQAGRRDVSRLLGH